MIDRLHSLLIENLFSVLVNPKNLYGFFGRENLFSRIINFFIQRAFRRELIIPQKV